MAKWNVALSTTETFNYIGMIQVRQGNKNSEVIEATITENGLPYDLTDCKVYFESVVGDKYPIQSRAKIIDAKKGKIQYTFDQYSMQVLHRQTADFIIFKDDELIATTQDFSFFVIKAVSKTEGETGSYWQSIDDLIADMTSFINENQGDFTAWISARKGEFETWRDGQKSDYENWFNSIKDILKSVDPGGTMLSELMDARVDVQEARHESISERLTADLDYLYQKLKAGLFTIEFGEVEVVDILEDSQFSENHDVSVIESVDYPIDENSALIVAAIDDPVRNVFVFGKVGEI